MLDEKKKDNNLNRLLPDTYGLHNLNCAFQNDENTFKWNFKITATSSMSKIVDVSFTHHGDYKKISSVLGKKLRFCQDLR